MSQNRFDEAAATWDDDPTRIERAAATARAIAARVPLRRTMKILDFGCGTGLLGFHLMPRVAHVTFVDPSKNMRAVVTKKLEAFDAGSGRVLAHDDADVAIPDGYDLVASLMTLHHIPDTADALAGMVDLIAPGGWLALVDLDQEDGSFHGQDDNSVHRGFVRRELQLQLEQCGLEAVKATTAWTIQKLVHGVERAYTLFLMTGRLGERDGTTSAQH